MSEANGDRTRYFFKAEIKKRNRIIKDTHRLQQILRAAARQITPMPPREAWTAALIAPNGLGALTATTDMRPARSSPSIGFLAG